MTTHTQMHVPRGDLGTIDNRTLERLREVARSAHHHGATPAEAEFLTMAMVPLLDELAQWRRVGAEIARDILDIDPDGKVIPLHPDPEGRV